MSCLLWKMTILSHITKIDSFDIDPVLLVIKLRLFVFDIRWFPSDNCTIGIFQLYSSTTNLNIAAVVIIGIFKHLLNDLMRRLITNEISNHLVLTATMLDVYFAIKNATPERSDTSTYPTGLRVIGAVAERPHYENPLCLH